MKKKTRIISSFALILLVSVLSVTYIFLHKQVQTALQAHPAFIDSVDADCRQAEWTPAEYSAGVRKLTSFDIPSLSVEEVQNLPADTVLPDFFLNPDTVSDLFYSTPITDELQNRIMGISYKPNEYISLDHLRYIRVLHRDFAGEVRIGELIVNQSIADAIVDIMYQLYINEYPIEKMVLIDNYHADDNASMNANNTSAFNFRTVANSDNLSNHSYGMAIDINPLYNPYVVDYEGKTLISPSAGAVYADRSKDFPHKLDSNDLCVQLFKSYGFAWGGDWVSPKDYQHFEQYVPQ